MSPDYKSQAYIAVLHKRELLNAWRFKWTNNLNPTSSGFQPTNHIPPSLKPTERFQSTNCQTFSRLIQCHTGHTHMGKYYRRLARDSH